MLHVICVYILCCVLCVQHALHMWCVLHVRYVFVLYVLHALYALYVRYCCMCCIWCLWCVLRCCTCSMYCGVWWLSYKMTPDVLPVRCCCRSHNPSEYPTNIDRPWSQHKLDNSGRLLLLKPKTRSGYPSDLVWLFRWFSVLANEVINVQRYARD